ncbi:putative ATP-dependent permease [Echria macrotheca]|uniref:ATP-dependent permease n=1 Tax=Echria macrotheca TaxID=438768 RepID=A0AAJ0F5K6_9PEZI|nr:putative ATP-dependent permease [Echria macrotheca]
MASSRLEFSQWRPCYSCCQEFWVPSAGTFGPQCLGLVGQIPIFTALLVVVLRYGLAPLWHRRPIWLRKFAAEEDDLASLRDEEAGGNANTRASRPWTAWTLALLISTGSAPILAGITAILWPEYSLLSLIPVIPCLISAILVLVERPRTLPVAVLLINSVVCLVQTAVAAAAPGMVSSMPKLALACSTLPVLPSLVILLNMPLRDPLLDSTDIGVPFTEPSSRVRSPEDIITLWQWMTVSWMEPLMQVGNMRQLNDRDVWCLPYEFQHSRLHERFRELRGSVFVRILKANGLDLLITTCLGLLDMFGRLAEPILLQQLLGALTREPARPKTAFVYAGLTLLTRVVRGQAGVFILWFQRREYERSRGEMITMIYEKTLRRKAFTFPRNRDDAPEGITVDPAQQSDSSSENSYETPISPLSGTSTLAGTQPDAEPDADGILEEINKLPASKISWITSLFQRKNRVMPPSPKRESPAHTGKILNLMRNDVYEVAQRFWEVEKIFTTPLRLFLSIGLVWWILGRSSLYGVAVVLIGMAINVKTMRLFVSIEQERRSITDDKLSQISQFIEAIRHLRWYAWQDHWLERIMTARAAELNKRFRGNIVLKAFTLVNVLTGYMFPIAGFLAYTAISGRPLTVDVAYPALNMFTLLQTSLRELPDLFITLMNASVAMGRIERFMSEPDKEEPPEDLRGIAPDAKPRIEIDQASFSWPGVTKKVLRDVSLVCEPGLTLVCGRVGAGKSALLQAVLGELDLKGGTKTVPREMIGYCAQTPWLESMSIRDNILFCAPYEKARFDAVIEACCLKPDLEKFRAKDLATIGENGVGLSGGQRARVALARAVYSRARILLLDDPIAALDHGTATHVMKNLFSNSSSSLMDGRLVIFVTHRRDIATRYASQVLEVFGHGQVRVLPKAELESHEEELEHLPVTTPGDSRPAPSDESGADAVEHFMEEELRPHGGVLLSVYWRYVRSGGLSWWVATAVFFALFRLANVAYFWFLKEWGERYNTDSIPFDINQQVLSSPIAGMEHVNRSGFNLGDYLPGISPADDVRPWLWWFSAISLVQVLAQALSDFTTVYIIYQAGKNLFTQAIRHLSNATFRFYDVTPVGRLMNRLTSDMGVVDGQIANQLMQLVWEAMSWGSAMVVIAMATPVFLVMSIAMTIVFVMIFKYFLPASQSLRRLETVSLTPLMSNFGALVEGLTTVRAFRASAHFQQRLIATTDTFQRMDHIYWSLQAWLQYRFDMLSALTTFLLAVTAVMSGLSGGTVGFVLAAASNFVQSTHNLCRKYGELQMQFVSVERVVELQDLEQEPEGEKPAAGWPHYGDDIILDHVTLRYAPGLDPVLQDVSLRIPGGANVAVTGRTGSGKSTFALSLLGTLHPDPDSGGTIRIGGVNIAEVDKNELRRNITFVAQDPVLFPGTLRNNLDPLNKYDDKDCADVLERVLGGESGGSGSGFTLDSPVDAGGKNLSQGQRQLVGLGRAILRRSPVVILDEATASIDSATAGSIQKLLREELRHSTVITIAHRKEAVKQADFEIVLDQGKVVRAGPLDLAE